MKNTNGVNKLRVQAGLKTGAIFLGVFLLLTVILCAILLPAIVVPFSSSMNVASAVESNYNPNLLKNGDFSENSQGELSYQTTVVAPVPLLTVDDWYIFGRTSLFLSSDFSGVSLSTSSSQLAYLIQPITRFDTLYKYTFSVVFNYQFPSTSRVESVNFVFGTINHATGMAAVKSRVAMPSASETSPVVSYTFNDVVMSQISEIFDSKEYKNGEIDLYLGIAYSAPMGKTLNIERIKFEQGETYTGAVSNDYDELLRNYNLLQANYNDLLSKYNSLAEEIEKLKADYESQLDSKYNQGYSAGYNKGVESGHNYTFLSLIGAVVDAPLGAFRSMFDFEILGMNMSSFMLSLFSISIIIVVIKLLIGR